MTCRRTIKYLVITCTWVFALAFLPLNAYRHHNPIGWDFYVYRNAILSLRAVHDPYTDSIAKMIFIRDHPQVTHAAIMAALPYLYSPITLPVLRWIAQFPLPLSAVIYLLFSGASVALSIYVCLQVTEPSERSMATLLAPLVLVMPGLIFNDVLYSGNIAFCIYGLILPAALLGWRRDKWLCFYLAVLLASCVKAPLLILLAIPVLSTRRQWVPTGITAALGIGIFAIQPHLWPVLFRNYLTAVELQFSINRDFGSSPTGILAYALFKRIPYKTTLPVFYLLYAIPVTLLLLYLRRRFLAGSFSLRQWIPVLILGVTLLNPRIMEYDIAPITLLMGLAAWRIVSRNASHLRATVILYLCIALLNIWAPGLRLWRPFECLTLILLFVLGVRYLLTMPPNPEILSSTSL